MRFRLGVRLISAGSGFGGQSSGFVNNNLALGFWLGIVASRASSQRNMMSGLIRHSLTTHFDGGSASRQSFRYVVRHGRRHGKQGE